MGLDIVVELPVVEPIGMELELVDDNYRFADNEHVQMEMADDAAEIVFDCKCSKLSK